MIVPVLVIIRFVKERYRAHAEMLTSLALPQIDTVLSR